MPLSNLCSVGYGVTFDYESGTATLVSLCTWGFRLPVWYFLTQQTIPSVKMMAPVTDDIVQLTITKTRRSVFPCEVSEKVYDIYLLILLPYIMLKHNTLFHKTAGIRPVLSGKVTVEVAPKQTT